MIIDTKKIVKYQADPGIKKLWNKAILKKDEESLKIFGLTPKQRTLNYFNQLSNINNYNLTINETLYELVGGHTENIDYSEYDEYSRSSNDIGDTISNIFSLCLGIYNAISVFLALFYSSSFDSYKIMEKILYNTKTFNFKDKRNNTLIELKNIKDKNDSLIQHNNSEDNNIIKLDDEKIEDNNGQNEDDEEEIKLPKFRFYEYLFNNIYSD